MRFMSSRLLHRAVTVASRAAQRAGAILAASSGRPKSVRIKSSSIDLVTDIDRASERLLHRKIARHFPGHGFQGEEYRRTHPDAPFQWIVDPLDGTMNFVHGVPVFAISIGLQHRGRTVAGVIYDPNRQELFTAIQGEGAKLNGRSICVSPARRLARGLLSTGFPPNFRKGKSAYLRWFRAFELQSHGVRRIGSTAVSLAYVACGRHEGFYEQQLRPWDIAAGLLLVEEAGGRVSDFQGRPVRFERGEVVASNGLLHGQMLALLR